MYCLMSCHCEEGDRRSHDEAMKQPTYQVMDSNNNIFLRRIKVMLVKVGVGHPSYWLECAGDGGGFGAQHCPLHAVVRQVVRVVNGILPSLS
jgi:hypothetical protein